MPRLTYFAGLALILLAGAFLVTDELTWRPGVTERNVRRIREGMTVAEVEALFGGCGDYLAARSRAQLRAWDGRNASARVEFFDGRVTRLEGKLSGPPWLWLRP